jgi:hypothetical protein
MILCDRIDELPPLLVESQQTVCCPNYENDNCGTCSHLKCTDDDTACFFDGRSLLLGKDVMDSNNQSPEALVPAALPEAMSGLWSSACEESIKRRIVQRTGGKIRLLRVEAVSSRVVICGCAPSYYLKQLALRGACDVLGSAALNLIELNVEVSGTS